MQNLSLNGNSPVAMPREKTLRHASLLSGTALAAWVAAGIFSPLSVEQALAACTAAPNIVCDDASYPTGLSYTNQSGGDRSLTVSNPGGTTIGSTAGTGAGVTLTQSGFDFGTRNYTVTIENSASSITTNNNNRNGITVSNTGNTVVNNAAGILTQGGNSDGINVTNGGDTTINNTGASIKTSGVNSEGINVASGGNIVITNAGTIETGGTGSEGINAVSTVLLSPLTDRSISITSTGDITTTGANSTGINAQRRATVLITTYDATGDIAIDVANVTATGAGSLGINATNAAGDIGITAGDILSHSTGVNAQVKGLSAGSFSIPGEGDIDVKVGKVESTNGNGINATTGFGAVDVTAGDVSAANGFGVNATANFGLGFSDLGGLIGDLDPDNIDPLALLDLGGVTVNVGNVNSRDYGINAVVAGGSITIPGLGTVSAPGIGNVDVSAGDVTSSQGFGINAATGLGFVTVSAGDVSAVNGYGVNASTGLGLASVDVGDVTARDQAINAEITGLSILGVDVPAIGVAFVNAGDVTSTAAGGINATTGIGAAIVVAGDVDSFGTGINAQAETGLAFALANNVETEDDGATGMNVTAGGVAIAVSTGHVQTAGDDAFGVNVEAGPLGDLSVLDPFLGTIDGALADLGLPIGTADILSAVEDGVAIAAVNDVSTTGEGSVGVNASALDGIAGVLATGTVSTIGENANGIQAYGDEFAAVISNDVSAIGEGSQGIIANAAQGSALVVADTVLSNGRGIEAIGADGFVGVIVTDVETTGADDAGGILAYLEGPGDVYVAAGTVNTVGTNSTGIHGETMDGSTYIVAGDVVTEGENSTGIRNIANGTSFTLFGTVTTGGNNSPAVQATDDPSDVIVIGGTATTSGNNSAGILADSNTADVWILVDQVGTSGNDSLGIRGTTNTGDVLIGAGSVSTAGDRSGGIIADSGDGDATVVAGSVRTLGEESAGITALAGEDATVVVDTVSTDGDDSIGIDATADTGFATVIAGGVSTLGESSAGIWAVGDDGVLVMAGTVATDGDFSKGIHADGWSGDATVIVDDVSTLGEDSDGITAWATENATVVAGTVTTDGDFAEGIIANAWEGNATVIADEVSTLGEGSDGITAGAAENATVLAGRVTTDGDFAEGIIADADDGNATVIADEVSTLGEDADGIDAWAAGGDATVVAGRVTTDGDNSTGISTNAGGVSTVLVQEVSTLGDFASGIDVHGDLGALVVAGSVTTVGEESHGIWATAHDGPVEVWALGPVNATGLNANGIDASSTDDSVLVVVDDEVQGGSGDGAGVRFGGETEATLVNLGSIGAVSDRAIVNDDRDSEVQNFGDVTGFVQMSSGADTFYNYEGARFIARGDSDFGDDQDEFYNSGLFTMADRVAPTVVNVTGLEVFDNSDDGVIDLTHDGIVGDILNLADSDYVGGGILAFDAELTPGGTADELHIGGNATGVTSLEVNDVDGGPGQYDPDGILFAIVNGTTDDTNFTTNGGIDKGLFRYDAYLRPNDPNVGGENGWYLASTLDREAYEFPIIAAGAQNLWHASTGTWLDRTADLRSAFVAAPPVVDLKNEGPASPAPGTMTPGAWLKVFGGTQERDISNVSAPPAGMSGPGYAYDDVFTQRHYGFMVGIDGGREGLSENGANEAWLAGVMAGYTGSDLDFDNSSTDVDYKIGSIGGYVTYLNGGFFADAALKADFGRMDYSSNLGGGVSDSFKSDFTSVGVILDTGYRVNNTGGWFFEPKATLAYVHTSFDDATVAGTDVAMENGDSLRGRLGGRVGTQFNSNGNIIEPYLEASIWHEFDADYTATLSGGSFSVPVSYDLGGTYGEIAGGASFINIGNGWSGFTKGSVQFGSDSYLGLSANLGVRKTW